MVIAVITAALVVAAYVPYAKDFLPLTPQELERDPSSATRVASYPFFAGVQNLGLHNLVAVKKPSATLAALAIAAGLIVCRRFRPPAVVWIPPAVYCALAMSRQH